MPNDTSESWLKFLNPESLKGNLIRSSIYLTCWEMLKNSVMDHPRDFYTDGWNDGKVILDPKYKTEVLALDNDPLIASALWFKKLGAISDDDIILLSGFRSHRNEIAHELPKFLGTAESNVPHEFFNGMLCLVEKIDRWWIQDFELPLNPDFNGSELSKEELDGVQSMNMIMMNLLIAVADGKEDQLRWLYTEMKKILKPGKNQNRNKTIRDFRTIKKPRMRLQKIENRAVRV